MRVDIISKGKVLRRIAHDGQVYVMAPKKGQYSLRVYNHTNKRRLAVITVDGINVITGKDGTPEDDGYVLKPWETLDIPGWRRDDGTVAAFTFKPEQKSYANKTGRGTSNVGVVGVAVFDERPAPVLTTTTPIIIKEHHHHHNYPWGWGYPYTYTTLTNTPSDQPDHVYSVNCSVENTSSTGGESSTRVSYDSGRSKKRGGKVRRRRRVSKGIVLNDAEPQDVGTGYGQELEFQTRTTTFVRATETPADIVSLFYATKARLQTWGIPLEEMHNDAPKRPQAFPSGPSVPAPPGWRG